MSNKFNGFTVDEIHKISSKSEQVKRPNGGGTVRKHTIKKLNGDTKTADRIARSDINQNNASEDATSANDTSNLSESTIQALQDALHYKPLSQTTRGTNDAQQVSPIDATTVYDHRTQIAAENNKNNNNVSKSNDTNIDDPSLFQGISLKDFEKHHKLMKEANLEKRRLLSNAIEQRFEQSIAEATKIAKIREELDKLDQELAADVEILRKEIEAVTLQYTATRENYHQIESQFLAAKLNLHQISEKKEMLTEHLCTIISHNEDRKAKKLTELLDKVGLNSGIDFSIHNNTN
ncbi:RAB6-interacting golgin [Sitodiplosis mosellana]|uniref:RAB6-interacting golgin n=1 Tax=Sitodiplosis mosellana TaxID=263140 RepID=UPI002444F0B6|nr:RAB6-interacting golgin [Sitodiplosis mosellana]